MYCRKPAVIYSNRCSATCTLTTAKANAAAQQVAWKRDCYPYLKEANRTLSRVSQKADASQLANSLEADFAEAGLVGGQGPRIRFVTSTARRNGLHISHVLTSYTRVDLCRRWIVLGHMAEKGATWEQICNEAVVLGGEYLRCVAWR